jgi:hypothetical protein
LEQLRQGGHRAGSPGRPPCRALPRGRPTPDSVASRLRIPGRDHPKSRAPVARPLVEAAGERHAGGIGPRWPIAAVAGGRTF